MANTAPSLSPFGPSPLIYGTAGFDLGYPRKLHLRCLEHAWEMGIRQFDTAPIYAHGQAEVILGEFLHRRLEAKVTTKCGLAGRMMPRIPASVFRMARSIARIRGGMRSLGETGPRPSVGMENEPVSLDVGALTASFEASLKRLRLKTASCLLLHEVGPQAANEQAVVRFIADLKKSGRILSAGLGGSAILRDQTPLDPIFDVVETEHNLGGQPWPYSLGDASQRKIAYGALRPVRALSAHLHSEPELKRWQQALDSPLVEEEEIGIWLIGWVLRTLPDSQVVFYSSKPSRISNICRGVPKLLDAPERLRLFEQMALPALAPHDT